VVSITEIHVPTIDQVLAVNVRGVVLGIKHAARMMLPAGTGSIINIGSVAGLRGGISTHIYSASKGAVQALTRSTAAELGETAIRVNCISPGAIVTGIFGKNAGLEGSKADRVTGVIRERFATIQPIPRAGLSDDIAQAAVFLASDGSGFLAGQDIVIDGGMTSITRGWSVTVAGRAETAKLIKAAAASL
jgi:NAD(P)-dependent dehydrogenase (short-subunit alcohol dehydrogenase family)